MNDETITRMSLDEAIRRKGKGQTDGPRPKSPPLPTWMRRRFIVGTKHASKSSFSSMPV